MGFFNFGSRESSGPPPDVSREERETRPTTGTFDRYKRLGKNILIGAGVYLSVAIVDLGVQTLQGQEDSKKTEETGGNNPFSSSVEEEGEKRSVQVGESHIHGHTFNMEGENAIGKVGTVLEGVISPFYAEIPIRDVETGESVGNFNVPHEYAREFENPNPLDENHYDMLANKVDTELTNILKDELSPFILPGLAKESRVQHGDGGSKEWTIKEIKVTGYASPEGPRSEGKSTIEAGNIDQENIDLAQIRASKAFELLKQRLSTYGFTEEQIDGALQNIDTEEFQFSQTEWTRLAELSENYPGLDQTEKIYNLIVDYNAGQVTDQSIVDELDKIIATKRMVEMQVTFEGEKPVDKVLFPIPVLLLLALLFPRRLGQWGGKNKNRAPEQLVGGGDGEVKPDEFIGGTDLEAQVVAGGENQETQTRIDTTVVPENIRRSELPDPENFEYKIMRKETIVGDLYNFFNHPDTIRRGLDYNRIMMELSSGFAEGTSQKDKEDYATYLVLKSWQAHDIQSRIEAGWDPSTANQGLDYINNEQQAKWARIHANVMLEIVDDVRDGKYSDYAEGLQDKAKIELEKN